MRGHLSLAGCTIGSHVASVIAFHNVSKRFRVEHQRPRSFQERFVRSLRRVYDPAEDVWVLREISFELSPGASLGVIGPNGAGKSTLLKLCARVIEPTSGSVNVKGRLSALLELGVGFHPDLTGRENVYLYGSLVGIDRTTMKRRFDDIVAFSEIARFIDLPVKHYSSGMYLRLAFAVAIHVDADMLLIDEAFAVGDDRFQRKCLGKLRAVQRAGVTTVFVSHNPDLVRRYCKQALWIGDGRIRAFGDADEIMTAYSERSAELDSPAGTSDSRRWGTRELEIVGVQFLDGQGRDSKSFQTGDAFVARIHYLAHQRIERPTFGVAIYRDDGTHINGPNTSLYGYDILAVEGLGSIDYCIHTLDLLPGAYELSAVVYDQSTQHAYDHQHRTFPFWVNPRPDLKERYGSVFLHSHWEHQAGEHHGTP